ncbi:decaprenyl-phosphate phosphoribosyltransferase [Synergistales bacterium]|nr:decaprenyl-phosphate phosphoribosyltransferase [Synergistales bacterium]
MKQYLQLLRPQHWVKNLLVFLPLVTSRSLFDLSLFARVCAGAAVFCLLSSVVYVCNDIMDADSDRCHPVKCKRPVASGAVTANSAKGLVAVLLGVIIAAGALTFDGNIAAWAVLALYFGLNIAYSARLKHVAIADVFVLASGYALRVYFCSAITGIEISKWLFLTLTVGALFMALGKRRGEMRIQDGGCRTRKVLALYSDAFLDKTMYICEAIAVVFYSLWSIDSVTVTQSNSNNIIFTVPFVLVIFMRYNLLLERDTDGDPMNMLMNDKPLLIICGVFAAAFVALLYAQI